MNVVAEEKSFSYITAYYQSLISLIQLASMNVFYSMSYLEDIIFYANLLLPVGIVQSPCCYVL